MHELRLTSPGKTQAFIDMHGHSNKDGIFIYGVSSEADLVKETMSSGTGAWVKSGAKAKAEAEADGVGVGVCDGVACNTAGVGDGVVPTLSDPRTMCYSIAGHTDMLGLKNCSFVVLPSKRSTGRVVCALDLGVPLSMVIEASFFRGPPNTEFAQRPFVSADFMRFGAALCRAMVSYWDVTDDSLPSVVKKRVKKKTKRESLHQNLNRHMRRNSVIQQQQQTLVSQASLAPSPGSPASPESSSGGDDFFESGSQMSCKSPELSPRTPPSLSLANWANLGSSFATPRNPDYSQFSCSGGLNNNALAPHSPVQEQLRTT
jgi:hypothetical protein